MKQLALIPNKEFPKCFGGSLLVNKRKSRRPLAPKQPTHLVLKSDIKKSGSLRKKEKEIIKQIDKMAEKFSIQIYEKNVNFDHIHMVTKSQTRIDFHNFNRSLAGILARKLKIVWLFRPYTRVIEWGKALKDACAYVIQNELEALGILPYTPRKRRPRNKPPAKKLPLRQPP